MSNDPVHLKIRHLRVSVGTRVRSILAFSYGDRKCVGVFTVFRTENFVWVEKIRKNSENIY